MIKVAVIGAGYWGPNIIRNFLENPECELVAVCDRDSEKLTHLQQVLPSQLIQSTDTAEILNHPDIDAIAIVTDIPSHFPLSHLALERGKHVFVEKPLAMSSTECAKLGELASRWQKVLMVGHTFIYNPAVSKLKEIVDSGELGNIYYLHAQRLNLGRIQTQHNALWSLAVHDIAITLHLFGERPSWVRAWGNAFITPGIEDVTFLNMAFPSGRLANLHSSWLDPEKKRQVTLVGSKKMVVYDDVSLDQKITLYDKGIDKALKDNPHAEYSSFSEFQLLTRTGDIHIPQVNFIEPLKLELQHFLHCVRQYQAGHPMAPLTGWQEGHDVVRVLEAAQESLSHAGIPIEIDWESEFSHV